MEITELIKKAQNGNKQAEERLIIDNSPLVWSIVKRFLGRGCEKDDLYQIGVIGLIKAINKFDFSFGVKFSTYAVPMIMGEIKRHLRDDSIIHISRGLKDMSAKIYAAKEKYEKENNTSPTVSQLAQLLGISAEEATQALEIPRQVDSLNEIISDNTGMTREQQHSDTKNSGEKIVDNLALKLAIEALEEREQKIITLRYFMDKTQVEVAREIGISQVQVSRLEKKVLRKIREDIV